MAWFAAYIVVLNAAELFLDSATAAMLVNLAPLLVAVASGLLLGEGLSVRLLAGVLVAFSGIVLITVGASTRDLSGLGWCWDWRPHCSMRAACSRRSCCSPTSTPPR